MEYINYILIGFGLGILIVQFFKQEEKAAKKARVKARAAHRTRLKKQHDLIKSLAAKLIEQPSVKKEAIHIITDYSLKSIEFSLDDLTKLITILQDHYKKTSSKTTFKTSFPTYLNQKLEPIHFWKLLILTNEALHNAVQHSAATYITNIVSIENKELVIITHDTGVGFTKKELTYSNGLKLLHQLVDELNGITTLTSTLGNGTIVRTSFPLITFLSK